MKMCRIYYPFIFLFSFLQVIHAQIVGNDPDDPKLYIDINSVTSEKLLRLNAEI
jgi:hypothetical protein